MAGVGKFTDLFHIFVKRPKRAQPILSSSWSQLSFLDVLRWRVTNNLSSSCFLGLNTAHFVLQIQMPSCLIGNLPNENDFRVLNGIKWKNWRSFNKNSRIFPKSSKQTNTPIATCYDLLKWKSFNGIPSVKTEQLPTNAKWDSIKPASPFKYQAQTPRVLWAPLSSATQRQLNSSAKN